MPRLYKVNTIKLVAIIIVKWKYGSELNKECLGFQVELAKAGVKRKVAL